MMTLQTVYVLLDLGNVYGRTAADESSQSRSGHCAGSAQAPVPRRLPRSTAAGSARLVLWDVPQNHPTVSNWLQERDRKASAL